jgi:hypothetical protein
MIITTLTMFFKFILKRQCHKNYDFIWIPCVLIKKRKSNLIYKEIQSGSVAKSYMRKGFLIYEEMRKYFPIYEEAVSHTVYDFATAPF